MADSSFEDFEPLRLKTGETRIFARRGGSGPPLLLLHGFPETHLMWRAVAPLLSRRFTVVCADLRGYGQSDCPESSADHAPYSKRVMANDVVEAMSQLGFARFGIAGHDRGGRVAYRLALDKPQCVERLALLDILTIADAWEHADKRLAAGYWPWSLLAQAEPLPERLVHAAPDAVIDDALSHWGSTADAFGEDVRRAYVEPLRDPRHVHAICEEYRAAATIDHEHDAMDRKTGRRIACPVLVLWSAQGGLNAWYDDKGGPLGLWSRWADHVEGFSVDGGHFFPEELPEKTAQALGDFFAR
jgi:haloacetate dehalogenase